MGGQPCMGACDRSRDAVLGLHDVCLSSHPLGGLQAFSFPHGVTSLPWDSCHTQEPCRGGGRLREEGRGQPRVQLQEGQS